VAWDRLLIAEPGENIGEALELLARAARLSPRDPRGWFITLETAWAYLVDGQFDEAIATALIQHPRSSFARRFIASCLARQGRSMEAAEALRSGDRAGDFDKVACPFDVS
jgi:hypothetical protein